MTVVLLSWQQMITTSGPGPNRSDPFLVLYSDWIINTCVCVLEQPTDRWFFLLFATKEWYLYSTLPLKENRTGYRMEQQQKGWRRSPHDVVVVAAVNDQSHFNHHPLRTTVQRRAI